MLKVTVLVSGGGTNLQAILDAIREGTVRDARVVGIVSSNPNAYALQRAAREHIPTSVVRKKDFPTQEEFEKALLQTLASFETELVVLAGYMVQVPSSLVAAYPNRIINVHPALIPSFSGKGCYGLTVHEMALRRGVKVTGATVHFVNEALDEGPIIAQKAVEVRNGDTPEVLQRRVMEEAEWKLLPKVIDLIAHDAVRVEDGRVTVLEEEALQ